MAYGSYSLADSLELNLGGYTVRVRRAGEAYVYERRGGASFTTPMGAGSRLGVYPAPPILGIEDYARYVMIKFSRELVLLPDDSVTLYSVVPVDIAVFLEAGSSAGIVDHFSPLKTKLAVHGALDNGLLCRSYTSDVYSSLPSTPKMGEAAFRLTIKNAAKRSITLRRLVLPGEQMTLFYRGDKAYLEDIQVVVETELEASIRMLNKPPVKAAKAPAIYKKETKEKWAVRLGYTWTPSY